MPVHNPAQAPCLVVTDLTKSFSGNIALDSFSIEIMPGQVHALVGHNGSGKSTFIKMLAGYYVPDSGQVTVGGQSLRSGDPTSSAGAGLSFVHQTLGLVPTLSVLENLHLGKPYSVSMVGSINWGRERATARAALERFGLSVDPRVPVSRLTTVEQVEVAIVRALGGGQMSVLVLDEPTAALTDQEVRRLFDTIRRITAQGVAVIYISHRLEEIPQIADVVTVLSEGRILERGPIGEFDVPRMVSLMSMSAAGSGSAAGPRRLTAARPAAVQPPAAAGAEANTVLSLTGLSGKVLRDFSLNGRAGDIVGVVGLLGSGLEELVAILSGRQEAVSGRLELLGHQVPLGSLAALAKRGLRVVIGDKSERIVPELSAGENATLSVISRFFRGGRLRLGRVRHRAGQVLSEFGVLPADPRLRAGSLSGGNQQKLAVAKALQPEPDVLVLEEPFHGVDIRGRTELRQILRAQAAAGRLVLVIDSDLDEITSIATTIIVLRNGSTALEVREQQADKRRLLEACYGGGGTDL